MKKNKKLKKKTHTKKPKKSKVKKMKVKPKKIEKKKSKPKENKIKEQPKPKQIPKEKTIQKEQTSEKPKEKKEKKEDKYIINSGNLTAKIDIRKKPDDPISDYNIQVPQFQKATMAFLDDLKSELLKKVTISSQEALDVKFAQQLEKRFLELGEKMIRERMPQISEQQSKIVCGKLIQEMLGLGDIDFLLNDDRIEEICVNGADDPIWIYHRKYGWMKTNLTIPSDHQIWNYSSSIARRVGRQINTQNPLLDAYLQTGDRVNATLVPISIKGNTITIRKFARKPWTITDYIKSNTVSSEVSAIMWLAAQYGLNMLISGGTGAGKTSLLNVLGSFIPQTQRVVSIEQTREITLPPKLQWVPMVVRQPTSEGKGGIGMLDLMVNSLRMRPDVIIVGEIRRAEEAQVLFEAMHTGHSVYATLHAETVSETLRRLTNPPMSIPSVMMESLHLITTMYRDKKNGFRRVFEVGEILPTEREGIRDNLIYRWKFSKDTLLPDERSTRIVDTIRRYTNMNQDEIEEDLKQKQSILDWMAEKNINTVEKVGEIISKYYDDPSSVLGMVQKK